MSVSLLLGKCPELDPGVEWTWVPVYALGGMTTADLERAWQRGAQGIAAIRGLWGDPGP